LEHRHHAYRGNRHRCPEFFLKSRATIGPLASPDLARLSRHRKRVEFTIRVFSPSRALNRGRLFLTDAARFEYFTSPNQSKPLPPEAPKGRPRLFRSYRKRKNDSWEGTTSVCRNHKHHPTCHPTEASRCNFPFRVVRELVGSRSGETSPCLLKFTDTLIQNIFGNAVSAGVPATISSPAQHPTSRHHTRCLLCPCF